MKVVISGGGTGGHVYPAIAIANEIKAHHPGVEILFIGTSLGLEGKAVPKAGYPIRFIPVSYLERKLSLHNVKSGYLLLKGLLAARGILKEFQPDLVIGTGGFVCGPVLYMAQRLGLLTLIHEQNVFPGLTNRILAKNADCVALSFEEAKKYIRSRGTVVVTGNPVRSDFLTITQAEARQKYGTAPDRPLVLVVGGSGGSPSLNQALINLLKSRSQLPYQLLWVTGERHYQAIMDQVNSFPHKPVHCQILPYLHDMPHALKACSLMIGSAGAISIAEMTVAGKAALLIPKAYTAENHQEYNAKALEDKGAARMIKEGELTEALLAAQIEEILFQPGVLEQMEAASKLEGKPQAARLLYETARRLALRKA